MCIFRTTNFNYYIHIHYTRVYNMLKSNSESVIGLKIEVHWVIQNGKSEKHAAADILKPIPLYATKLSIYIANDDNLYDLSSLLWLLATSHTLTTPHRSRRSPSNWAIVRGPANLDLLNFKSNNMQNKRFVNTDWLI